MRSWLIRKWATQWKVLLFNWQRNNLRLAPMKGEENLKSWVQEGMMRRSHWIKLFESRHLKCINNAQKKIYPMGQKSFQKTVFNLGTLYYVLGASLVAQWVKNPPAGRETWVRSLDKSMATHSSLPAWRIPMDRGASRATVHGISKSQTQLSDFHTHTHTHYVLEYVRVKEFIGVLRSRND